MLIKLLHAHLKISRDDLEKYTHETYKPLPTAVRYVQPFYAAVDENEHWRRARINIIYHRLDKEILLTEIQEKEGVENPVIDEGSSSSENSQSLLDKTQQILGNYIKHYSTRKTGAGKQRAEILLTELDEYRNDASDLPAFLSRKIYTGLESSKDLKLRLHLMILKHFGITESELKNAVKEKKHSASGSFFSTKKHKALANATSEALVELITKRQKVSPLDSSDDESHLRDNRKSKGRGGSSS